MDIVEKSKEYAKGKALDAITSAIEQAYAKGYEAGYDDGISSKNSEKILIDGVEYIDLNLPSGTLWASDYLKDANNDYYYMVYDEAVKLNVPTFDQYKELIDNCLSKPIKSQSGIVLGTKYIGKNGKILIIKIDKIIEGDSLKPNNCICYWLKSDKNANTNYKLVANELSANRYFSGFGLPIMLVKQKVE